MGYMRRCERMFLYQNSTQGEDVSTGMWEDGVVWVEGQMGGTGSKMTERRNRT